MPLGQGTHCLPEQIPERHTWPQAPQLSGSVARFVSQPSVWRLPLQSANPDAHVPVQTPFVQVRVAMLFEEQTTPQPPQLLTSVPRVTQVLPHRVWPDGHVVTHWPFEHV